MNPNQPTMKSLYAKKSINVQFKAQNLHVVLWIFLVTLGVLTAFNLLTGGYRNLLTSVTTFLLPGAALWASGEAGSGWSALFTWRPSD